MENTPKASAAKESRAGKRQKTEKKIKAVEYIKTVTEECEPDFLFGLKEEEGVNLLEEKAADENDSEEEDSDEENISSTVQGRRVLQYLLGSSITAEDFYADYWEKQPLVIKRHAIAPEYYMSWFSQVELQDIFKTHALRYGADVDVTKCVNGFRKTLNPSSTTSATPDEIRQFYQDEGASIRLLCPQKFADKIWRVCSVLEDEFECQVGCNSYLTPAGTQGFAPHYDDIEGFLCQVEGKKHWKIYAPLSPDTTLPRSSSTDFSPEELPAPIFEVLLECGDLLYLPRGFIHQGLAETDAHSLHLTFSTAQRHSWMDLLELVLPQALAITGQTSTSCRHSLPLQYGHYMGVMHSDLEGSTSRTAFQASVKSKLRQVLNTSLELLDGAVDQVCRNVIVDRLPPVLTPGETQTSVEGLANPKFTIDARVRLLKRSIARMTIEQGKAVVYHCMENSRQPHEIPLNPLEFEIDDAESIEAIFAAYPDYIRIGDLPHEDAEDQLSLVQALYEEGILVVEIE